MKTSMRIVLLVVAALFNGLAFAQQAELNSLLGTDKLLVKAWATPQQVVAKQKVQVFIELATESRFSAGTRIQRFEIPNAIVLQREKFAVNSTRRINGTTYTVQLWSLDVFPLEPGDYQIPELGLEVSVAKSVSESITGVVSTRPMPFTATLPPLLENIDDFVSTSRLNVEESFDKSLEELQAGDAITRTIRMSADDIPAMMLPEVPVPQIEGMGIYPEPAQIRDENDRGTFLGERIESLTYVFERPGQFVIPPLEFHWWNTQSQTLESIALPEYILEVGGEMPVAEQAQEEGEEQQKISWDTIKELGIWVVIVVLAVWIMRALKAVWNKLERLRIRLAKRPPAESKLQKQFSAACRRGDNNTALNLFYRWADLYAGKDFDGSVRTTLNRLKAGQVRAAFDKWMTEAYGQGNQQDGASLEKFAEQVEALVKQHKPASVLQIPPVELKLN